MFSLASRLDSDDNKAAGGGVDSNTQALCPDSTNGIAVKTAGAVGVKTGNYISRPIRDRQLIKR
jgi:hypothetical protein